jgi:hypothetical protein
MKLIAILSLFPLLMHAQSGGSTPKFPTTVVQGDLSTPNTAAVQSAISTACSGSELGSIRWIGLNNTRVNGSLDFSPCSGKYLEITIYNRLSLGATLTVPANVLLDGQGSTGMQFQDGSVGYIACDASLNPCVHITGNSTLRNIAVHGSHYAQIYIDNTAFVHLYNVGAESAGTVATSVPLVIDGSYWIWIEHSSFSAEASSYPASVRITCSNPALPFSSLIYMSDSVISGTGIQVDSQIPQSHFHILDLHRLTYETGTNATLSIDTTNIRYVSAINLDTITIADQRYDVTTTPLIHVIGAGSRITGLTVSNSSGITESGSLYGLPVSSLVDATINRQSVTNNTGGFMDLSLGSFRFPEVTFASPPSSPTLGQVFLFSDASQPGVCTGGGSSFAQCRWSGSAWAAIAFGSDRGTGARAAPGKSMTAGMTSEGDGTKTLSMAVVAGSATHAVCWKTATTIGYCSTVIASDGTCTCN